MDPTINMAQWLNTQYIVSLSHKCATLCQVPFPFVFVLSYLEQDFFPNVKKLKERFDFRSIKLMQMWKIQQIFP